MDGMPPPPPMQTSFDVQTIGVIHEDFAKVRKPSKILKTIRAYLPISLFVVLPSLLTGVYFFGYAADQYESEADFVVRNPQLSGSNATGLSQFLGLAGGMTMAEAESFSIGTFLSSHDAVFALQKKLDLVKLFRRPEADILSRLWWDNPTAEILQRYYDQQVTVSFKQDTGITKISAHAFRPEDARVIVNTLLDLGEKRINEYNERAINETLRVAQSEVSRAEERVVAAQRNLTDHRMRNGDIDPQKTSSSQLGLVAKLQEQLAQLKVKLSGMLTYLRSDNAQVAAVTAQIKGIENQIAIESAKLTGQTGAMAPILAEYEQLRLQVDFAQSRYASALSALETARIQAFKQQLFVTRIVEPNLPERALFPRSTLNTLTVFFGLLLSYGIGWLVIAGMREHTA